MVKSNGSYPKKYLLKAMPEDVYRIVITRQAREKLRLGRMISMEHTIYKIIKESENKISKHEDTQF